MAHLFDNSPDDVEYETPEEPERRRWVPVAAAIGLAMLGSASAVLWNAWGSGLPAFPSFTSSSAAPAEVPDKTVALKDFQAFQAQMAATLQSTGQLVAAQQAEIKRLSDQVAALAAKIDTLQRPAASAQAAVPAAPPPAPAPAAPRKRPAAAKPPPGISTGGAPLPLTDR